MGPKRSALLIATSEYADSQFRQLHAPPVDADTLKRVLEHPSIGDYAVEAVVNGSERDIRRKISEFFRNRSRDDVLLLYFSGHGVTDDYGSLYFAAHDTQMNDLEATAVSDDYIRNLMNRTSSRNIVLLLDCCYSGMFSSSMLARSVEKVQVQERFHGRGWVVLTASTALQSAWERKPGQERPDLSLFTGALVEGLTTGLADANNDGIVSVREMYDYIYDHLRNADGKQTPTLAGSLEGDLILAKNPRPQLVPLTRAEAFLHRLEPFASLPDDVISEVARLLMYGERNAGEVITRQGSVGDELILVERGEVELVYHTDDGQERVFAGAGAGDYVGEISFLRRTPQGSSVRARTPVEFYVLRRIDFDQHLERLGSSVLGHLEDTSHARIEDSRKRLAALDR